MFFYKTCVRKHHSCKTRCLSNKLFLDFNLTEGRNCQACSWHRVTPFSSARLTRKIKKTKQEMVSPGIKNKRTLPLYKS